MQLTVETSTRNVTNRLGVTNGMFVTVWNSISPAPGLLVVKADTAKFAWASAALWPSAIASA